MRIGIHSGMVLSGIIGVHKWQFDIWSEDTILASMMEHDGVAGYVHITKETFDLLPKDKLDRFDIEGGEMFKLFLDFSKELIDLFFILDHPSFRAKNKRKIWLSNLKKTKRFETIRKQEH